MLIFFTFFFCDLFYWVVGCFVNFFVKENESLFINKRHFFWRSLSNFYQIHRILLVSLSSRYFFYHPVKTFSTFFAVTCLNIRARRHFTFIFTWNFKKCMSKLIRFLRIRRRRRLFLPSTQTLAFLYKNLWEWKKPKLLIKFISNSLCVHCITMGIFLFNVRRTIIAGR